MKLIPQRIVSLLVAAVMTGAFASVVQTQINLSSLIEMGAPVTASMRVFTTLEDVGRFGPVMAGIAAIAFLPAFLAAALISRNTPLGRRAIIFAVVTFAALWVMFWLMREVIPMPAIAATRFPPGHALMALTGLCGGLVYAVMTTPVRQARYIESHGARRRYAAVGAGVVLSPAALFLVTTPSSVEQPDRIDPASYQVETVTSELSRPWSVAFLPDGRLLVTEMAGRLLAVRADGTRSEIDLNGLPAIFHTNGTHGLLEVALDPQFEQNGFLYLTMGYGEPDANGTRLVRARLVDDRVEDVRVLFSSTLKPRAGNNGGRIAFLKDDTLVLTLGDGSAQREQAQDASNHLGTLVRIDREGRAPSDNPFVHSSDRAHEVYSFGHRNVQGIVLDPANGELLITEHGPRGGDEINRIVPGGNYGWPIVTAGIDYPFARVTPFESLEGYQDPLLLWTPSIAPAGLAIYDGELFPGWKGSLIVPALKGRSLRLVLRDGERIVGQQLLLAELGERMRDVKVAPDGSIYVLTDGRNAKLLRLVPTS